MTKRMNVLFENGGVHMMTQDTEKWMHQHCGDDFIVKNVESRDYYNGDEFYDFYAFMSPVELHIFIASGLKMSMPFEFSVRMGLYDPKARIDGDKLRTGKSQFSYYVHILFYALRIREKNNLPPITIHLQYHGDDFIEDLMVHKDWGDSTASYVKLMLRQQDNITINIYDDYKLIHSLTNEEQLGALLVEK